MFLTETGHIIVGNDGSRPVGFTRPPQPLPSYVKLLCSARALWSLCLLGCSTQSAYSLLFASLVLLLFVFALRLLSTVRPICWHIMAHSMRVLVYARVSDIPGNPQARHIALGDLLTGNLLGRRFYATPRPPVYDHVHIPADFDSSEPLERWFIFDLNVGETLSRSEVTRLPHLVYLASRQGDDWCVNSAWFQYTDG